MAKREVLQPPCEGGARRARKRILLGETPGSPGSQRSPGPHRRASSHGVCHPSAAAASEQFHHVGALDARGCAGGYGLAGTRVGLRLAKGCLLRMCGRGGAG